MAASRPPTIVPSNFLRTSIFLPTPAANSHRCTRRCSRRSRGARITASYGPNISGTWRGATHRHRARGVAADRKIARWFGGVARDADAPAPALHVGNVAGRLDVPGDAG